MADRYFAPQIMVSNRVRTIQQRESHPNNIIPRQEQYPRDRLRLTLGGGVSAANTPHAASAFVEHRISEVKERTCLLPSVDLTCLGPAEIPGMRMIDNPKNGFTCRADHNQDLHSVDASVPGAGGIDLDLAMGTFHVGTSDLASAVAPELATAVD